jgi:hypothetical protein
LDLGLTKRAYVQQKRLNVEAVKRTIRSPGALPVCRKDLLTSPINCSEVVVLVLEQSGAGQQSHSVLGFAEVGSARGLIIVVVIVVLVVDVELREGMCIPYMVSSSMSQRSTSGSSGH